MENYYFNPVSGDLTNIALKIEYKIGRLPDAWGSSNIQSWVAFNTPLTGTQQFILTGFLNQPITGITGIDRTTGNTTFRMWDIMDHRQAFKNKISGLNFQIFPSGQWDSQSGTYYVMEFDKALNQAEKNLMLRAWSGMMREI